MKFATKIFSTVLSVSLLMGSMALFPVLSETAFAQMSSAKSIVDLAKSKGLVGERIDGYLGLVMGSVSPDVQSAVNEINIRRKTLYTKLAREQGVEIAIVAKLTGEKLIAKAKPGEKIMGNDGIWHTK